MSRSSVVNRVRIAIAFALATALISVGELRAERVGYQFSGTLSGTGCCYTLFSIPNIPRNAPVTGTFSFDTANTGEADGTGARKYHQSIQGGYTLNINNGQVQLAANDYLIRVTNDYGFPAVDSFIVDYTYDSLSDPPVTPQQLTNNGPNNPWNGSKAQIYFEMQWPSETFPDPDDLALTANKPSVAGWSVCSFCADVASSGTPRFFSVTSVSAITPPRGDYNVDGKVDSSDYTEWRKAFGATQPEFLYADGSDNGLVDAADYVDWRAAMVANGASATLPASIPEPASMAMIAMGVTILTFGRCLIRR